MKTIIINGWIPSQQLYKNRHYAWVKPGSKVLWDIKPGDTIRLIKNSRKQVWPEGVGIVSSVQRSIGLVVVKNVTLE